ncbi:MAG TPA: FKBP-type peptidyl-prolyl cis-trans isomerase [Ilumatobacteraceae bacterium]|nr:FKBP-type peptidyl-prolyl cis-trans isomerase [Ilumatobacteraceae bacterium]
MRRTLPLLVTATLLFAACSGSDDNASDSSASTVEPSDTSETAPDTSDTGIDGSVTPPATNPDKPDVEVPDEVPTELQVTVIEEGTGQAAEAGDTVIVDYVGVRTRDGVEFDNSYDRFEPLPLVLGQGEVIAGWDQGLVGVQGGSRVRIDIPSDLAYGAESRGEIIGENEALTFLIDVRAVVAPADPADEPAEPGVDPSEGATGVTTDVLREGDGDVLEPGQSAIVQFVLFRGDNGVALQSSWTAPPQPLTYTDELFPPLYEGMDGMRVGERRAITFPPQYPEFGFGPEGNPTNGLPAETDLVIVVDLVAVWGEPAS